MSSNNKSNQDEISAGSNADNENAYVIENQKENRKFKSKIFGGASIFALACLTIWALRVPLSQTAFKTILKAKGIDADLELKTLGLNAAGFKTLKIGPKGNETLVAENGILRWSFSPFDGFLSIEEIKAENLNAHFAYNKGKFDFRSLSPLFGGKGGGKTKIENINVPNAHFIIDSDYGRFAANLRINGNLEKLNAIGDLILPQAIESKPQNPIKISFFGQNLNGAQVKSFGARLDFAHNDLNLSQFAKDLNIKDLSGGVNFGLGIGNQNDMHFVFRQSALGFAQINQPNASFLGARLNISPSDFSFQNDWSKSAIFDLNFALNAKRANFQNQHISDLKWNFDIVRGVDGKTNIVLDANNGSLQGAVRANDLNLKLAGQIISPELKNIDASNFDATLNINANQLYLNQGMADQLQAINAQDIAGGAKANLKLALNGNLNEVSVNTMGAQRILGRAGSLIEFTAQPVLGNSQIKLIKIDDEWQFSGAIKANMLVRNQSGGNLNARMSELSFNNHNANINIDNIVMRNFKYDDFILDTNRANAKFVIENNNIRQGRINGAFGLRSNGEIKISPSSIKLDAQFANNRANFIIDGKIPRASIKENLVENANLRIAGSAYLPNGIKSRPIDLNTNINGNIAHLKLGDGTDARNFALSGPLQIRLDNGEIAVLGRQCLQMGLSSLQIDDNQITSANGHICPDASGRFVNFASGKTQAFAQTDFEQLDLQMGNDENANHIVLSGLRGHFEPNPNGAIKYIASAPDLHFTFATGPQTNATISAKNSELAIASENGITSFNARLFDITSQGLGVETSGDILLNFNFGPNATQGSFTFRDLLVKDADPAKRFSDLKITGSGNLRDNKIYIEGNATQSPKNIDIAFIRLNHNLRTGIGNIVFDAKDLSFIPAYVRRSDERAFDIDDIIPALKGILVDVDGKVDALAQIDWSPNAPVNSFGIIKSTALNFDTLLGPVTNLSGDIRIDDLFKMKTSSTQEIKVGSFNPGLPILNGVFGFNLTGDNSLEIESAQWPFADGILSIEPTIWQFDNGNKLLTIKVDNIDLAQFLRLTNVPNLEIDGRMSGSLPVHIIENDVQIIGGKLRAREGGGTVRYTGPSFNAPPKRVRGLERLRQNLFGKPPAQGAVLAENALRNLKYQVLELRVDGRITGDMTIGATLLGSNTEVLNAAPFLFNVNMSLPVGQIQNAIKNATDTCATLNGEQIEGLEDVCPNNVTRTNSGAPN